MGDRNAGLRVDGLAGRLHDGAVAQLVPFQVHAGLDEVDGEGDRGRVVEAVGNRQRIAVGDAALVEDHHRHGPRLGRVHRILRTKEARAPLQAGLLRRELLELAAHVHLLRKRVVVGGEAHDHLLQLADEPRLVEARVHGDRRAGGRAAGDFARLARAGLSVAAHEDRLQAALRHRQHVAAGGVVVEIHVARDHRLEDCHPPVLLERAAGGELRVDPLALGAEVRHLAGVEAGLEFRAGANRAGAHVGVDGAGVLVEDFADLLARERLDAAVEQRRVDRLAGGEAELLADAVDFLGADAAGRERADESVLDRENLVVRESDLVGPALVGVVVDLVEGVLVQKADLAGVDFAGGNLLELVDRDVDVREIDVGGGHGRFPSMVDVPSGGARVRPDDTPRREKLHPFAAPRGQPAPALGPLPQPYHASPPPLNGKTAPRKRKCGMERFQRKERK